MINVFISHPTPYNSFQQKFLDLVKKELRKHELNPVNLDKNSWSYKSPLEPIREIMLTCKAAIIIGLERHHSYIGYDKEKSIKERSEVLHKYTTSPWVQIEAGMAYQANIPLLILKEKKVYPEGILDPQISGYYVFEFDINKMNKKLSAELEAFILSWVKDINELTSGIVNNK